MKFRLNKASDWGSFWGIGRGEIGTFTRRIPSLGEIVGGEAGENFKDFYSEESP